MEKMTYVVALNSAIDCGALSPEVVAKLTALREQMEKKANAIHKPTATQVANADFKVAILEAIGDSAMTITEMMGAVPAIAELSNQRVSAIVRQMVADGQLKREEVKRKAYFSKVDAE